MKVLKLSISLFLVSSSFLIAGEVASSLDTYISENKTNIFTYEYKKNIEDSSILRDSWINPINLNYSYSKSNPYSDVQLNESAAIKMDQPIFRGGGIFYGIKFANASKSYADYSVDIAKRKMIKDAISILMQIKQTDLKISKQELQIQNAKINLELKKEQYLSGQLDSGFLDNAIIERNFVIQALYDIQTAQEGLISSFKTISDLDYKSAKVPLLKLISQEEFLEYNLDVQRAKSQAKRDEENKGVIRAKYLPTVSVTAGYYWTKSDSRFQFIGVDQERDYYDYGIKFNMPISISAFRDMEASSIEYLKSEVLALDKKREQKSLFEKVMQSLDNLAKKQSLSIENMGIYDKLLIDTRELFRVGYKTEYDVKTLENSFKISELDSKIYEMDKQLELLNLYELYYRD